MTSLIEGNHFAKVSAQACTAIAFSSGPSGSQPNLRRNMSPYMAHKLPSVVYCSHEGEGPAEGCPSACPP